MIKWPDIDFKRLLALNPETIGWLHLEGTPIDYPVVRSRGDDYYLKHNFTGEESPHGCVFAVPGDVFPGSRSTLHGHNMKDNSMFSHLLFYYCEEGFIDKHPVIELKTPDADYEIRVWSTMHFPNGCEFAAYPPTEEEAFAQWKQAMIRFCPFGSAFELRCEDDIMVFCTCRPFKCEPDGTMIVIGKVCKTNAQSSDAPEKSGIYLTLVNKTHPMDFSLLDKLVLKEYCDTPGCECTVEETTLESFRQLKEYVSQYGVTIGIVSGFRTFEEQAELYAERVREPNGSIPSLPGESEHHTGLAVDIVIDNNEKMGDIAYMSRAYVIVHTACPYFGFIVRYPCNKQDVTGYDFEPWHLRYVGQETAMYISEHGFTLEEYSS